MKKLIAFVFIAFLAAAAAVAQQADIPLRNWTVPPYQTSSASGIHTMTDVSPPRAFVGLAVCRLLDTRPPVNNPLDGDGIFATDEIRTYDLDGQCGIPGGADAVSLNITVTNTVSNPFGHLKIWPASQAEPNVSTLNWNAGGLTVANAAIVALSSIGQLRVKTGNAGADVIIDTNGYFAENLGNPQNALALFNNSTDVVIAANNASTTCIGSCGIQSIVSSGYALYGNSLDTNGAAYGVYGEINTLTTSSAGVRGFSDASTGVTYGVWGTNDSVTSNSAGVRGTAGVFTDSGWENAGVRGEAGVSAIGVLGTSRTWSVIGSLLNSAGGTIATGYLGTTFGTDPDCVFPAPDPCFGPWAVFGSGNIGASGVKHFVDPHPSDASKVIGYISLEGPEAGTYFRGRARFQNGIARIEVPEHFRMVTDPEGLTVQITPIGGMATVGVLRMDLNEIVVQSSRSLEFSYLVQGVRSTFKDTPIEWKADTFRPRSPDESAPAWLSPGQRARLIANGTYKADGTVNMETAQRLGWDRIWAAKEHPIPQPTEP